jgi:hypothetical protein
MTAVPATPGSMDAFLQDQMKGSLRILVSSDLRTSSGTPSVLVPATSLLSRSSKNFIADWKSSFLDQTLPDILDDAGFPPHLIPPLQRSLTDALLLASRLPLYLSDDGRAGLRVDTSALHHLCTTLVDSDRHSDLVFDLRQSLGRLQMDMSTVADSPDSPGSRSISPSIRALGQEMCLHMDSHLRRILVTPHSGSAGTIVPRRTSRSSPSRSVPPSPPPTSVVVSSPSVSTTSELTPLRLPFRSGKPSVAVLSLSVRQPFEQPPVSVSQFDRTSPRQQPQVSQSAPPSLRRSPLPLPPVSRSAAARSAGRTVLPSPPASHSLPPTRVLLDSVWGKSAPFFDRSPSLPPVTLVVTRVLLDPVWGKSAPVFDHSPSLPPSSQVARTLLRQPQVSPSFPLSARRSALLLLPPQPRRTTDPLWDQYQREPFSRQPLFEDVARLNDERKRPKDGRKK